MNKQAISVTLSPENLMWLRGQTRALARRSVSETLDRLVSEARTGGRGEAQPARSVVGTIRIAASDPVLSGADATLRALFRMPLPAPRRREPAPPTRPERSPRTRRG
jgi:hypothetical protein